MPCVILTLISRLVCPLEWISWHLLRAVTLRLHGGGLIAAQSADKIDPSGKIDPGGRGRKRRTNPAIFARRERERVRACARAPSSK